MVEQLSPRERECLALVTRGASNEQIAARLGVSADTVASHLGRAYIRLSLDGLGNPRAAAAALWARSGPREE